MTHFTTSRSVRIRAACVIACLAVLFGASTASFAQGRPALATAATYAAFTSAGAITVTTGDTAVLNGGIGYSTGSIEGFPPSTATFINPGNSAAVIASSDLMTAYNTNSLQAGTVTNVTITNVTFTPGVYQTDAASTTGGNVTFNAQGDSAAIFIVNIGSGHGTGALSVASGTHMLLENNARAGNVYWFVGGAVTVHDSATFTGTIVAGGAIIFLGQSTLTGRALTTAGQIALAANHMSISNDTGQAGTNNLTVTKPASGDSILSGTLHDTIKWTGTGIALGKTIQYSLDTGHTWTTIASISTASLFYLWNVPDTTSTKALVRVTDSNNLSGVSGIFKIIANKIIVVAPAAGALITGGMLHDTITWTGTGLNHIKTFAYSLDSGLTWTTIGKDTTNGFTYLWNVPNTGSAKAVIRITDSNGVTGMSGVFTIRSISVIAPAAGALITEGTLNDTIKWTGTGLNHIKTFAYSLDSGLTWTTIGKDTTIGFTYLWNVPNSVSTKAMIRITDSNGVTGMSGVFTLRSSKITVVNPAAGVLITEGTLHDTITWTGTGLNHIKTFAYSLDSGKTWITIGKDTTNGFTYLWNVPDTVSTKAMISITDSNGITGMSGMFTLLSNKIAAIVVTHPAAGESIVGGTQAYQITWTGTSIAAKKTFALSLNGGPFQTIGTITANVFAYSWNVPDTASTQAVISITDSNGVTGKSGVFTILSSKIPAIVVVTPAAGESIVGGTQAYQITWTGTSIAAKKTFALSLNGGSFQIIGKDTTNGFIYLWNVPDTASTQAVISITDSNGVTGKSGIFIISKKPIPGSIVIVNPAMNEVIAGGKANYQIVFTDTNVTAQKTLEYSLDDGANWSSIGSMNSESLTFPWALVPNVATTQALVRITDSNGVVGTSGLFTITFTPGKGSINLLTLSGLDSKNNIGNNKSLGISWTFTAPIGKSVDVEYSLDNMATWSNIGTVLVTLPSPNSTTWLTDTGYHKQVNIRVTSTDSINMTATSIQFSIGSLASVASDATMDGYSISNYPNPVTEQTTTIDFVLPVRSDVTLIVSDNLGRQISETSQTFDAGEHNIPFNTAQLSGGVYTYTLVAGSTRLNGRMNVVR